MDATTNVNDQTDAKEPYKKRNCAPLVNDRTVLNFDSVHGRIYQAGGILSYIDRLEKENNALLSIVATLREQHGQLEKEFSRFKEGQLTIEEFHNLCHNLSPERSRAEFEKGCKEYQDKLFERSK